VAGFETATIPTRTIAQIRSIRSTKLFIREISFASGNKIYSPTEFG
jgi:hypothetical protein